MAHPTQVTDHVTRGIGLILSYYQESPGLLRIAKIMLDRVQEFEDLAFAYLTEQLLPNAQGIHLERLGRRIGQLRGLFTSDADYRRIIEARVLANTSEGNFERLVDIVDTVMQPHLTGTLPDVRLFRFGRAHLRLEYDVDTTPSQALRDVLAELLTIAVVGGVSWTLVEVDDSLSFRYDVGPGYDVGTYARIVASG